MIVDMKFDTQEGPALTSITSLRSSTRTAHLFFNCVTTGETELGIIHLDKKLLHPRTFDPLFFSTPSVTREKYLFSFEQIRNNTVKA